MMNIVKKRAKRGSEKRDMWKKSTVVEQHCLVQSLGLVCWLDSMLDIFDSIIMWAFEGGQQREKGEREELSVKE